MRLSQLSENTASGISIRHIDPEEDWDQGEQADQICKMVQIRPERSKSCTIVAVNQHDEVIGAVYTKLEKDRDATESMGEPVACWDFDVVVHPEWQGQDQVGIRLIRAAEEEGRSQAGMYYDKIYTRLYVVNPKLVRVLQHPKFGYQSEGEYSHGAAHLVKY